MTTHVQFLRLRLALAATLTLIMSPIPLAAQQARLSPAAIGQIANVVLGEFLPPAKKASRVEIAKRGIYFDHERTLQAFGVAPGASFGDLRLRNGVKPGSRSQLADCSQVGGKPCNELGWGVYAYLRPISFSDSDAVVIATFLWPDRGSRPFVAGATPKGFAVLVGFSTELHLVRSNDGTWRIVGRGVTHVS